jgi:magnesium-transporting ATPase (P-type)
LLIVKGAPESMRDICTPASLSRNLPAEIRKLTLGGFRVLGELPRWVGAQGIRAKQKHLLLCPGIGPVERIRTCFLRKPHPNRFLLSTWCGIQDRLVAHGRSPCQILRSPGDVSLSRSSLESGMSFVGLISMENKLKKETRQFLVHYKYCRMRLCMITGDNPM